MIEPVAPIEFDTPRLRLRQWCAADRQPFAELNADPRVMEYFPAPLDRAASDAMADRCQSLIAERGWGLWAVQLLQEPRAFIGFVGLNIPTANLPCSPCVEVGWRLAMPYWRRGLALEAARGALQVGFETLELDEIVAFTAVQNRRSRALMERLDMRQAPDTFEHPAVPPASGLREHCLYRLSRRQWLTSAAP